MPRIRAETSCDSTSALTTHHTPGRLVWVNRISSPRSGSRSKSRQKSRGMMVESMKSVTR